VVTLPVRSVGRHPAVVPRSRRKATMTVQEAERIADQAARGRLDVTDPSIARTVGQANRVLVRAETWGRDPEERRRTTGAVLLVLAGIALFLVGLTLALALSVVP
jgi:hypothetical protein